MDVYCFVECFVDFIVFDIRFSVVFIKMEVNGITIKFKGLVDMEQFYIFDVGVRSELVRDRGVNYYLGFKLIVVYFFIKAVLKICLNSKFFYKK